MRPKLEQAIIFLHIPKTGGTTLNRILERQLPAGATYHLGTPRGDKFEALLRMPDVEKARLQLIHGHIGFGLHRSLPQPAVYFTLLRDPVKRVISNYYFIRRTPDHTHYPRIVEGKMSPRDYVLGQVSPVGIDNGQLRLLCGAADAGNNIPFGGCTPELLNQAKANLREHFSVTGLMEHFDATLILLRRTFGWRMPFYVRENVNHDRAGAEAVDQETRDLIAAHNTYDTELYAYAQERFQQQLRRHGPGFRLELRSFRLLNAAYGRAYHSRLRPFKNRLITWLRSN